jgi:GAF domain-containing protein
MEVEQFLLVFQKQMDALFHCRVAEIWRYDQTERELWVFQKAKRKADLNNAGIVGEALTRLYPLNCLSNRTMSSYHADADGKDTEPVLVVPSSNIRTNITTAVCLRGGVPVFTHHDQRLLSRITAYVVLAINNFESAAKTVAFESGDVAERKCMETLSQMVDLVQQKAELSSIVSSAVENMELLTHADRSTVFAVDRATSVLMTLCSTGKDYPKVIHNNRALPARAYSFGEVLNLADAYEDIEFDSTIDLETGYRTRSALALPMMNSRAQIIGAAEFLNRADGNPFPNADVNYLRVILTFTGMMIDTDYLQREILSSTQQLRSFLSVAMSLMSDVALQAFLRDIMKGIRRKMKPTSVVIYLLTQDASKMRLFLSEGVRLQSFLPMSHGVGSLAFKSKESIIATDAVSDPRFVKDPFDDSGVVVHTIAVIPIVSQSGDVFGVVEAANKPEPFSKDEIVGMKSFGALIALALDNRDLTGISEHGNVSFEMDRWIDEPEKPECTIPARLQLMTAQRMELVSSRFDAAKWPGIGLFQAVFCIFSQSGLMSEFQISAETLFSFIYALRETYSEIPFHNWPRAVNILQFVHVTITIGKLENLLSKADIASLYIAALCQDAGYTADGDGPADAANALLGNTQSASSSRHCAVTVTLLSATQNNILKKMRPEYSRIAWDLILRLIVATDMANHWTYMASLRSFQTIFWADYSQKGFALTMLLKCATLWFMTRDPEIAESRLLAIREELGLDPVVSAREELFGPPPKWPIEVRIMKDNLAFATIIVLPLFVETARLIGAVKPIVEQCEAITATWKLTLYPPVEESTSIVISME